MFGGIPVNYFAVWLGVTGFAFLFLDWKMAMAGAAPLYGVMWSIGQYEPNFVAIAITVLRKTPKTQNKSLNEGDLYRA